MDILCNYLLKNIYSFMSCKQKLLMKGVCRNNNKIIRCKTHNFKDLYGCETHFEDCNISYVIYTLKLEEERQQKCKLASTIHFGSNTQMSIANKYLSYFGIISHFCCGVRCVMFKDKSTKKAHEISSVYYLNDI